MGYRAFAVRGATLVFLSTCVSIRATASDLIPFGANWRYLNPITAAQDPTTLDATFDANWHKANYNANSWSGPSPEPFARADVGSTTNNIEAFTATDSDFIRPPATLIELPASGSRLTSYFRTSFTTTSPTNYLALEYLFDDGAHFYLDGNELLTVNCCNAADDGKSSYLSRASSIGNERTYTTTPLMIGQTLPAGTHTVAVSIHQNVGSSNDMAFSMKLMSDYLYDPFIQPSDTFKYYEGFDEPSTNALEWATASFADNAWSSGPGGLGYDTTDTAPNTALPLLGTIIDTMQDGFSSLYVRKAFSITDSSKYGKLQLNMDWDDGFVAYINGTEVVRSNVNGNVGEAVPFDSLATDHESTNNSGAPGTLFEIDLSQFPNLLKSGNNNVLAIHGLNTTLDSSDFVLAQISLAGLAADPAGTLGDFDGNGVLDAADIDALTRESAAGTNRGQYDVTSDGLVDASDVAEWARNLRKTWIGDANVDGEFGSSDLVVLFVAGTYENGAAAAWTTGDFNGDGLFTTSDLVSALTDGGYERGPRAAISAVPEPAAVTLLGIGLLGLLARRQS
ncbi:MAG: PEP-CTERM sorting domain-containing protein [Planctomycetales bacterium]|nr:PEP-CTERM sorting domain-containing protein [Planctomycetales bacterium]